MSTKPRADSCAGMNQPPRHRAVAVLASADCRDDYEFQQSGPEPPAFPVEVKITTHSMGAANQQSHAMTELVTDLSRLPLDPQIFDLPTGFKRVDKLDNSPNLPWLLRGRLMWQSVKSTVWGWTPWGH